MILDLVATLGGLVVPPLFDFVKKKFLKPNTDSPEATMSTLAVQSPEQLGAYVSAMSTYLEAQTKFFNRDVVGTTSPWVNDLRAAIRPIGVVICFAILALPYVCQGCVLDAGVKMSCEVVISSWFGTRMTQ